MNATASSDEHEAFASLTPDNILDAVEASGVRCDGRMLALNSYENRVYQVGVEDGPSLVAKFYRPMRWSDAAILEEHDYTRELAQRDIPVIAPLVIDGKTLLYHGPYRFSLYPCHGGRPPELDCSEELEQLGRFIGRMHAYGSTGEYQHRSRIDIESMAEHPRSYLLQHGFIPEHIIDAYDSVSRELIDAVARRFDAAGDVSWIRLHGDCHPGNILWTDSGPHIVDFDDARMGPAIQDLWMFLSGDRDFMSQCLGDLLQGYTQFHAFNPVELQLIEALRSLRIIHYEYWLASRWHDPAFPRAFPWFDSIRHWEDHVLALREQLAALAEEPLNWLP